MHMQHYCRLLKEDTNLSEREGRWDNGASKLPFKAFFCIMYFFVLLFFLLDVSHIMSYYICILKSTVCQPWLSLLLIWTIKDYIINFGLKPQQSVWITPLGIVNIFRGKPQVMLNMIDSNWSNAVTSLNQFLEELPPHLYSVHVHAVGAKTGNRGLDSSIQLGDSSQCLDSTFKLTLSQTYSCRGDRSTQILYFRKSTNTIVFYC